MLYLHFPFLQFDRGNRSKSDSQCGLEEVLSMLRPSEFEDRQLSRYKGMCWNDFVIAKDNNQKETSPSSKTVSATERVLDKIALQEAEDSLGNLPSQINDKTMLLGRECSDKKLTDLVEATPPTVTKRRHPRTLMRTMSERTLDRGRASNFFSSLSERVHHEKSSRLINPPLMTTSSDIMQPPSPQHQTMLPSLSPNLSPKQFSVDLRSHVYSTSPSHSGATTPTQTTTTALSSTDTDEICTSIKEGDDAPSDLCTLEGVERMLEAAKDNAQAAHTKNETKRREAVWDLFQSECTFLYDHLMVLKNVSTNIYEFNTPFLHGKVSK